MPAPSESQLDWAANRPKIEDLYWNHGKELPEVMKTMKSAYGFVATKKMYKKHFKAWGLEKNLKTDESIAMIKIRERRRLANKDTVFIRHGKPVEPGKLRRFEKRHKLTANGSADLLHDAQVSTPPNITYTTPEPDPSSNSFPPAPLPYPDPETSEEEQATIEDSPESFGIDSDGSPPSRNMHWEPPLPNAWSSDDPHPDSRDPTHAPMAAGFISDAFSPHGMPEISHGFSRINMSPTFSLGPWSASEYQVPNDGAPHWIFNWQQQQHTAHSVSCGSDRSVPAFSSNHSPTMGHALLGMSPFGNTSPAHGNRRIPDIPFGVLDHTPLHNAVVYNDVNLVRALLNGGANPNCAARGGMTPLHYAAYQRNIEMVTLLLDYGANLDTLTDKGRSVLFFAVRNQGHLASSDMAAYTDQNGVGSTSHTDEGTMAVIKALFNAPTRWNRLLRSLEKADKNGVTPLMIAAGEGFCKTANKLLKRGARPEVRDHANHTALKYAARNSHRELVRLLLLADPAVSCERDLSHILKLASKNFTARATTGHNHGQDGQARSWDSWSASALIAEEMARLCQEMDVLDGLLRLAKQRCKTHVLELLLGATRQLGMEREGSGAGVS